MNALLPEGLADPETIGYVPHSRYVGDLAAMIAREMGLDPEYAAVLGRRIKCLHVHDNNGSSDQHMAPLTGTVNWGNFCSSLRDAGYDGDLSFETFNQT